MTDTYILDTSAVFTFLQDEPGADRIAQILESVSASQAIACISFMTITELFYVTWQETGESTAIELLGEIKSLPVQTVESDEQLNLLAGQIKATNRLSLGDSFIAATAYALGGVLVHKDPEFEQLKSFVKQEILPYKPKQRPHK